MNIYVQYAIVGLILLLCLLRIFSGIRSLRRQNRCCSCGEANCPIKKAPRKHLIIKESENLCKNCEK
jgi:hypothetical protein